MSKTDDVEAPAFTNPAYEGEDQDAPKTGNGEVGETPVKGENGANVAQVESPPKTGENGANDVAKVESPTKTDDNSRESKRGQFACSFRMACTIIVFLVILYAVAVALALLLMLGCDKDSSKVASAETGHASPKPHIVFVLADDLGWYDVGYNNPEMLTPNIDSLAADGVIFNQTYTHPLCSPSRSALMSGLYAFKTGMQHRVLQQLAPYGLPTNFTILPAALKPLGYTNHLIGKWHLGMCKEDYLPLNRGFDSFYGFLNNYIDYYDHTNQDIRGVVQELLGAAFGVFNGYDFWDNTGSVLDKTTYISYLLGQRAVDVIEKHNKENPMFMFYSSPLPHFFIEVPKEYENLYSDLRNRDRRIYNGMVSMLDEIIGNMTNKLKEKGMWDNTLFVFMSDNGGAPDQYGFNYPLRGGKATLFEAGGRVVTFAAGGLLEKTGYTNDGLMHMTDWYPTFVSLAGGTPDPSLDGMDMWDMISKDEPSPRNEIVYNIDEIMPERGAAIRVGDWKLIEGNPQMFYPIIHDHEGWYLPPTEENQTVVSPLFLPTGDPNQVFPPRPEVLYLFNLKDDPTEHHDLAANETEKVAELQARLNYHRSQAVPALHPPPNFAGDPALTDGIWRTGFC
ncbi:arylsulfatase B-like [Ptychodera flava]|uniref:arylsulfatase B-like n=1 Tax=Ptychodera flava TaxID=63121 RepID=UPI003969D67B